MAIRYPREFREEVLSEAGPTSTRPSLAGTTAIFTIDTIDGYVDILASVAGAIAAGNLSLAHTLLSPISGQRWMGAFKLAPRSKTIETPVLHKRAVTDRAKADSYLRDRFVCHYCGHRSIPLAVLVGISDVFPDQFAYHTNYKKGAIHPAFWLAPEADHHVAHVRGGADEPDNLVTLHAMCNLIKSDSLAEDLPAVTQLASAEGWDGLLPLLPTIAEIGNHRHEAMLHRWMRLFGCEFAASGGNSPHLLQR